MPPRQVTPLCHSLGSARSPFVPLSHSKTFKIEEWNGKSAWTSSLPGSQIRLRFTGSRVGLFVYVTNGQGADEKSDDLAVRRRQAPGRAKCWVEDDPLGEDDAIDAEMPVFDVDTYDPNRGASGFVYVQSLTFLLFLLTTLCSNSFLELAEDLEEGEHVLACEISSRSGSGGYKWRLQGIASY